MIRVSQEAINRLGVEMRSTDSHGAYTMNRLRNEDPRFASIADSFLAIIPKKNGEEVRETVRDIIAACYRIIELSEKYPDIAEELANTLLTDPLLQNEKNAAIISAEQETTEILQQYMLHAEK